MAAKDPEASEATSALWPCIAACSEWHYMQKKKKRLYWRVRHSVPTDGWTLHYAIWVAFDRIQINYMLVWIPSNLTFLVVKAPLLGLANQHNCLCIFWWKLRFKSSVSYYIQSPNKWNQKRKDTSQLDRLQNNLNLLFWGRAILAQISSGGL